MACDVLKKARRLVLVAQGALLNGELERACSVLRNLQEATSIEIGRAPIADSESKLVRTSPQRRR